MENQSYWEWLKILARWHVPVSEHTKQVKSIDEVIAAIEEFAEIRGKLAYQTDGMVIKVDSFEQRERLGATSKAPRWVIAFKYAAEQIQTVVRAVEWQVGQGRNADAGCAAGAGVSRGDDRSECYAAQHRSDQEA